MKTFDIAVVGCGGVSQMHFATYMQHTDRIRIAAVCDPVTERVQETQDRYGVEAGFPSLEEMLQYEGWDVGVVCTPTPVRLETVRALAEAGKHVFVEKPMADTYEEAVQLVKICDQADVKLAVNQNFRYHYPFDVARDVIAQGRIGDPVSIAHQNLMFRQDTGWRTEQERHAMSVMGIHWLDGFRWMLDDEPESVVCDTRSSSAIDCAGETEALVQMTFGKGSIVSYVQSLSYRGRRTETIVFGDKATLVLSEDGAEIIEGPKNQWSTEHVDNPYGGSNKPEATFQTLNVLLTAIENGNDPSNSGRDNLKTVKLLDEAYRSAAERRS